MGQTGALVARQARKAFRNRLRARAQMTEEDAVIMAALHKAARDEFFEEAEDEMTDHFHLGE